jgi:hypothetical protein
MAGTSLTARVDKSGLPGIFEVGAVGGAPHAVVLLNEPGLRLFEAMTVCGKQPLVTLAEYQADVWTVQLKY